MNRLLLERPICFLDLETTSADRNTAKIIEMTVVKVLTDRSRITKTWLINPEVLISPEATAVHGFDNDAVKEFPIFETVAMEIFEFIMKCDLGGFNSNTFDIPVLFYEFARVGLFLDYKNIHLVDVCNIFKKNEQRTLSAAVQFYLNKELVGAHGAQADIEATMDVLEAQFERYNDIPSTVKELAAYSSFSKELIDFGGKFTRDSDGELTFTFGKNKGLKCKNEIDYLKWMVGSDFPPDVKYIANQVIDGKMR